jgi:hypothetical protein
MRKGVLSCKKAGTDGVFSGAMFMPNSALSDLFFSSHSLNLIIQAREEAMAEPEPVDAETAIAEVFSSHDEWLLTNTVAELAGVPYWAARAELLRQCENGVIECKRVPGKHNSKPYLWRKVDQD